MIPYRWQFWKRWRKKKPEPKRTQPAELTLNVAIEGYERFMEKLSEMEKAIETFGAVAEQASKHLDAACERFAITYNIINKED